MQMLKVEVKYVYANKYRVDPLQVHLHEFISQIEFGFSTLQKKN